MPQIQDQEQRNRICGKDRRFDLTRTFLIEAAAGTGKTTNMSGRMVALLAEGVCKRIEHLVAVTFTRKAAAELRSRFRSALEHAFIQESDSIKKNNLGKALAGLDKCFIGTVHSFCARILREHPIEAGVDIGFTELDETQDQELKATAWHAYTAQLYRTDSPYLSLIEDLGLEIGALQNTFENYTKYPDVTDWVISQCNPPDLRTLCEAMDDLVGSFCGILNDLNGKKTKDSLANGIKNACWSWRQTNKANIYDVMEVLKPMCRIQSAGPRVWKKLGHNGEHYLALWNQFCSSYSEPACRNWLEYRHYKMLPIIKEAAQIYADLKLQSSSLNYEDLLLHCANLLRNHSDIRSSIQQRYPFILVDEFQDTDPIQAEMLCLLTASDVHEKDWKKCSPKSGSLFVVGDPKQSIYRFRRADIVTYNEVRRIIEQSQGEVLNLFVNFRTEEPIINWVNSIFGVKFQGFPKGMSPKYINLVPANAASLSPIPSGVHRLVVPTGTHEEIASFEAEMIASIILKACRPETEIQKADFGDFLILLYGKKRLGIYSKIFQKYGIPHQVTGGDALNKSKELFLLNLCLKAAASPNDPIALVALLVSELHGFSDQDLYEYALHRGRFTFYASPPQSLDEDRRSRFEEVFLKIRRYTNWIAELPPITAIEKIVEDVGLFSLCTAALGPEAQSGSLAKALEIIRTQARAFWSVSDILKALENIVVGFDPKDGIPAKPYACPPVRIMNLHKAKGLEAPYVFLADPSRHRNTRLRVHIDRSADAVRGYMPIYTSYPFIDKLLAAPAGWDNASDREALFNAAEEARLLYVAATRAGKSLIISERAPKAGKSGNDTDSNGKNPWAAMLETNKPPELTISDQLPPPSKQQIDIPASDYRAFLDHVEASRTKIFEPTYATATAKTLSSETPKFYRTTENKGTQWGTVVHTMLQAVMNSPESDLKVLAQNALEDNDLAEFTADEVLDVITRVTASDIWARARSAKLVFTELPFQYVQPNDSGIPTLIRGIMDLVFQEESGWVIVDYKTDRAAEKDTARLMEIYRPQITNYAEAWVRMTGEPVSEAGIYFTHADKFCCINQE